MQYTTVAAAKLVMGGHIGELALTPVADAAPVEPTVPEPAVSEAESDGYGGVDEGIDDVRLVVLRVSPLVDEELVDELGVDAEAAVLVMDVGLDGELDSDVLGTVSVLDVEVARTVVGLVDDDN